MAKEANKVNDVRDLIISEWIRNPNASIIFFADSMADLSTGGRDRVVDQIPEDRAK